MVRIALASAVLLVLRDADASTREWAAWLRTEQLDRYRPLGILWLFGDTPPSVDAIAAIGVIAWLSTIAMLIGLASRASAAISLVSTLVVCSLRMSFLAHWSHSYNVVLVAQMAFLGARGGDAFSVDRLIRAAAARFGIAAPFRPRPGAYQWSIRLVVFACAAMFLAAAAAKLAQGRTFPFAWALSDSLRHHILLRFDMSGVARTPLADWLVHSQLLYKTAASLNLLSQLTPFLAVVFVRRPVVRLLCAGVFAADSLALGLVMDLWNPQFLPLAAVFVDWDWLAARLRLRRRPEPEPEPGSIPPLRRAWIAAYLVTYVAIAFVPRLDARVRLYPFSSFPVFSTVRAKPPWTSHQSYEVLAGRVYVDVEPSPPGMQSWLNQKNRWSFWKEVATPTAVRRRLDHLGREVPRRYPATRGRPIAIWAIVLQVPAYPARAEVIEHRIGRMGERLPDGTIRTALGRAGRDTRGTFVDVDLSGLGSGGEVRFAYHRDNSPEPTPLTARTAGSRHYFEGKLEGEAQTIVAIARDPTAGETVWFVAQLGNVPW